MNKSGFLRIHDVVRFVDDVFGKRQSLEIEGGDAIMRNEGRRAEDVVSVRTFLEPSSSDIVFAVTNLVSCSCTVDVCICPSENKRSVFAWSDDGRHDDRPSG